ncbi:MAG: nucleotidyltransferase domain-containing protein [Clostridia bacterium]|nr:nucleotidyltransferase domain-containing protein [Clostridia bacterium]
MINITQWIEQFQQALERTFAGRIWFLGLQGSYGRGEATDTSDIDVVVILDEVTVRDIQSYREMLDTLPHRELICGFISGKREILHWESADLFQFYHDTTPILGSLDELLPLIDNAAVRRAIKTGAGNIYHGCVHNMIHERSDEILRGLYKSAAFVAQAVCFLESGRYVKHHLDLLEAASEEERAIIGTCIRLKNGGEVDFDEMSGSLVNWAARLLGETA